MTRYEVAEIFGDLGLNTGASRLIFECRLPDGRPIVFYFDGMNTLEEVDIQEPNGEVLEYDLDEQELLISFKPYSLQNILYGMSMEEVEKILIGDSQYDVSFYGDMGSHPIALITNSYTDTETDTTIHAVMIKLSTGSLVIMGFEKVKGRFDPALGYQRTYILLYVYMQASDGEWYLYDLNTQELTEERAPKEKIFKGPEQFR
jgi:hypothetical protein